MNLFTTDNQPIFLNANAISDAQHEHHFNSGEAVTFVHMISGESYFLFRSEFDKLFQKEESEPDTKKAAKK